MKAEFMYVDKERIPFLQVDGCISYYNFKDDIEVHLVAPRKTKGVLDINQLEVDRKAYEKKLRKEQKDEGNQNGKFAEEF